MPEVIYFGESPQTTAVPGWFGVNFQKAFETLISREPKVPQDYGSALSYLIGQTVKRPDFTVLTENEATVLEFVRAYSNLLTDFSDFADFDQRTVKNRETIIEQAIFNQRLAQDLRLAKNGNAVQRTSLEFFVETIFALARADTKLGEAGVKLLSAARSQAGVMDLLEKNGYKVEMPDIEKPKEVEEWDFGGGFDFIAIKNGVIYLIDVKGRTVDKTGAKSKMITQVVEGFRPAGKSGEGKYRAQKRAVKQMREKHFIVSGPWLYLEVHVPSSRDYLDTLGNIDYDIGQTILEKLANFEIMERVH